MYIQPATLGATLVLAVLLIGAGSTPAPAAPGLTGAYYLPSSGGYSIDGDGLAVPARAPDATRVDAQIAFGEGKGFTRTGGKKQFV